MEPITRKEIYLNQIAKNTGGNGGETGLTPITREEMYFDAIVKNTASGGGGGSSLPAVTAADNGDVLTVVNGAWDKAAPGGGSDLPATPSTDGTYTLQNTVTSGSGTLVWGAGGGGPLVIHVDHNSGASDRTWQEVSDALTAGQVAVLVDTYEDYGNAAVMGFACMAIPANAPDYSQVLFITPDMSVYPITVGIQIMFAETADDYLFFD